MFDCFANIDCTKGADEHFVNHFFVDDTFDVVGVFLAVVVEILGLPVLPFAIGVYLPVQLNACIMVGGLVRLFFNKMKKDEKVKRDIVNDGILFCSGMIAGEGIVGILLALLAVFGVADAIDISAKLGFSPAVSNILSLVVFALIIFSVIKFSLLKKRNNTGR